MCPPNLAASLFTEPNQPRLGRAIRLLASATALELAARWHWWRMESCDSATSRHQRKIIGYQLQVERLRQELGGETFARDAE